MANRRASSGLFATTILTKANVRVVWRSTERGGEGRRQDIEGVGGARIALAKRAQSGPGGVRGSQGEGSVDGGGVSKSPDSPGAVPCPRASRCPPRPYLAASCRLGGSPRGLGQEHVAGRLCRISQRARRLVPRRELGREDHDA